MARITLYGADYTPIDKFVLKVNDISAEEKSLEELSVEFVKWFADKVLMYAFYDESSGILKKVDGKDECLLQNAYNNESKSLKYREIYPWSNDEKISTQALFSIELSDRKMGGVVGCFGVNLSRDLDLFKSPPEWVEKELDKLFSSDYEIGVAVILGSRFDMFENGDPTKGEIDVTSKQFFLLRMLEVAFPEFHLQNSTVSGSMDNLWNYLYAQMFKNSLLSLYKLGFYREYVRFEKNDDRLKGKIDISRHIRLNGGKDNGKIAYSYRKKTEDNKLNHLIIKAYECLLRDDGLNGKDEDKDSDKSMMSIMLEENPDLKRIIQGLKVSAPSGGRKSSAFLLGENNTPITSPYYQPYERMRIICAMILRRSGVSFLLDEDKHYVDGVLLYVPDLFEIYVQEELENELTEYNKNNDGHYILKTQYVLERPWNHKTFRPDYVIFKKGDEYPKVVLDAKFRHTYRYILDGTKKPPFYTDNDIVDDCQKLIRDVSCFKIKELESKMETRKELIIGGLVFPVKDSLGNIDMSPKSDSVKGDPSIKNSTWSEKAKEEWEPECDEARIAYLSAFRGKKPGERGALYNEAFYPGGKVIWYCGIPVCAINESDTYINWRKRQDTARKEAIGELYKVIL